MRDRVVGSGSDSFLKPTPPPAFQFEKWGPWSLGGSQEESGEDEAACRAVGSLLSVIPLKRTGGWVIQPGEELYWTTCFRLLFSILSPPPPTHCLPPCLWVRQLLVSWSTHIHPSAVVLLPSGLLHTLFPPGRPLVHFPDQLLFFKSVSIYLAALGLSCGVRDLRCGVWLTLVACTGSLGLSSCGTRA